MRRLKVVLCSLAAVAVLAACSGSDDPDTNANSTGGMGGTAGSGGSGGTGGSGAGGGSGGMGGTGGSGATGGSGGTGGSISRCGDGVLDEGEECDDGNAVEADGCSPTCEIEGTCARPLDWEAVNEDDDLGDGLQRTIRPLGATQEGSCGGAGRELVFRVVAPHDGMFVSSHAAPLGVVHYVRTSCEDATTQLWCAPPLAQQHRAVEAGEELFVVVDLPAEMDSATLDLRAHVFPYVQEGDICTVAPQRNCAPGLTCQDLDTPNVCTVNEPPVLDSVRALRASDDLIVLADGRDPNGNQNRLIYTRFYDEEDRLLQVADLDRDGVLEPILPLPIEGFEPRDFTIDWTSLSAGFFAEHPRAVRAEMQLRDEAGGESEWVSATIEPQPEVTLGDACDLRSRANRCAPGTICHPDGSEAPVCQTLAGVRQARCDAAPLVTLGASLEGTVDRTSPVEGRGFWDPPAACIAMPLLGPWTDAPEGLARLHLDEAATNLVISTAITGSMDSVVYLFPGCGTGEEEPIACSDETDRHPGGELRFDELPAGDYLIVIDLRRPGNVRATWDLRVDVEP